MKLKLLGCIALASLAANNVMAQNNIIVTDQAKTRFGDLKITIDENNMNSFLWFNDQKVNVSPDNTLYKGAIVDIYQYNQQDVALISDFSGGTATNSYTCFLAIMDKNGVTVQEPQGCIFAEDHNPTAGLKHGILTISLGYTNHQNHQIEFDGKKVSIYDWKTIGKSYMPTAKCQSTYDLREDLCDFYQGKNHSGFMARIGGNLEFDSDGFNKDNFDKLCINRQLNRINYQNFETQVCQSN